MTSDPWAVVDWRRRTHALYSAVRVAQEPTAGHALWVTGRDELLRLHSASPVPAGRRAAFAGATVARYDPAFRFVVPVSVTTPATHTVETGSDGTVSFDRVGVVSLPGLGALDLWWLTSYGGGLFLPLRDATSGQTTYGGGRYLLDSVKGADLGGDFSALTVDLNFAYQPSCAYDEAWACPLPAAGNTLVAAVPVGELLPPH